MMYRILLTLICSLLVFASQGQEILLEKQIDLDGNFINDKRISLPAIDHEIGEVGLFLLDNSDISCVLLNKRFQVEDTFSILRPETKTKDLLGYSILDYQHALFFANKKRTRLFAQNIDVTSKKSSGKLIAIDFKSERYLESVSYRNKFYVLTIVKNTSTVVLYTIQGNTVSNRTEFDYSGLFDSGTMYTAMLGASGSSFNPSNTNELMKIDINSPTPLDIATKRNKMFFFNNQFIITMEQKKKGTQLIQIKLDDYSTRDEFIPISESICQDFSRIKSNSYVYKKYFFRSAACKDEFIFEIMDLETLKVIYSYNAGRDDLIEIMNTPLMQEGAATMYAKKERELKTTSQFLRKLSKSNLGVSVYKTLGYYEVTLGGYKEFEEGGSPTVGFGGGSGGFGVGVAEEVFPYNPTMGNFDTYLTTRSVFFRSKFSEETLQPLEGPLRRIAFDKIGEFEEENKKIITTTVFKMDGFYVFGYYDRKDNTYYLRRFED